MKILIVAPTLATWPFLSPLAIGLSRLDWDVHLAASDFKFQAFDTSSLPVTFHPIPFPRGADIKGHYRASRLFRKLVDLINPDIIDVHFTAAMLTLAMAKQKHWPPTVATVQGLRFPMQSGVRRIVERTVECWAARKMDEVAVLTRDDFAALQSAKLNNVVLQVAPGFGCDLIRFDRSRISAQAVEAAKSQAGVQPHEQVFIYVGRRIAFKGFTTVIRAFLKAVSKKPSLRLIVCGNTDALHPTGLTPAEEEAIAIHPQISELGWTENVEDFLAISDLALFPSRREGMPVNLMEALAMGVPVVTCDARGCRDIVDDQQTGIVLPDFDVDRFANAVLDLINDDERRNEYSQTALIRREKFDCQLFVNERISRFTHLYNASSDNQIIEG